MESILEKNQSECKALVTVNISKEEGKRKYEKTLRDITKDMQMPGFQKGKIPISLIEPRLDLARVYESVGAQFADEAIKEILTKNQLSLFQEPKITEIDFEPNKDSKIITDLCLLPEITLSEYENVEVTVPSPNKLNQLLNKENIINTMLRSVSFDMSHERTEAPADANLQEFDTAIVSFKLSENMDEEKRKQNKSLAYKMEYDFLRSYYPEHEQEYVVSPSFLHEDIYKNLLNMKAGEQKEVTMKIKENEGTYMLGEEFIGTLHVHSIIKSKPLNPEQEQKIDETKLKEILETELGKLQNTLQKKRNILTAFITLINKAEIQKLPTWLTDKIQEEEQKEGNKKLEEHELEDKLKGLVIFNNLQKAYSTEVSVPQMQQELNQVYASVQRNYPQINMQEFFTQERVNELALTIKNKHILQLWGDKLSNLKDATESPENMKDLEYSLDILKIMDMHVVAELPQIMLPITAFQLANQTFERYIMSDMEKLQAMMGQMQGVK